ncbi:hypothetical protein KI387_033670 [Taxus chinensis]|uniref:non-specific serine/threonine protein kinase n=1 Tax=Taxus chinensis TaxID=29808 RepID=A0AA38F4P3_TAXCH|nr:hypothetical protein KI387_033670 [Taxus chinensis]
MEKVREREMKRAESKTNCTRQEISPAETSSPVEGEIVEDITETETPTWTDLSVQENSVGLVTYDKSKCKHYQMKKMRPRTFLKFGKRLKVGAYNLKRIVGGGKKVSHNVLGAKLNENPISFAQLSIKFTMKEMIVATNRFQHKLGEGGFGYVYKGTLPNGKEVVIKKSRNETSGLLNELVTIGGLHHRNILKLLGYCIRDQELMLDPVLDWGSRFKIILGVISALTYLHKGGDKCIVHRDIKPTNILLDENFNAKISDFGLARQVQQKDVDIPALHNGNIGEEMSDGYKTTVAGTLGYIAPEYLEGGHMTKKGDIYSFGVLVLEMISGRRAL